MRQEPPERHLRWLAAPLVIGLGLLVFGGTLHYPVTGDDVVILQDTPQIYDPAVVGRAFLETFGQPLIERPESQSALADHSGLYRPLLVSSYFLNARLFGVDPSGWRLTNLLLHLLASVAVMGLATRLLSSRLAGLTAGLLFVMHPCHVEALASLLGGRSELMATAFVALSWWLQLVSEDCKGSRKALSVAGSLLCLLLGLFSKENAAVLPGVLFLTAWGLRGHTFRAALVQSLPHAGVVLLFAGLHALVVGRLAPGAWSNLFGDASAVRIFLLAMVFLANYLRILLLPYPIEHQECYTGLAATVSNVTGVACALLVLGLLGFAFWRLCRTRRMTAPSFLSYGILFFYLALLPVSHIVPFRVYMATRFLYLPSIALCLLAGSLIVRARAFNRFLPAAAGIPLLGALIAATFAANTDWADLDRLYGKTIACAPRAPDPHNNLGTLRLRQGRPAEAIPHFQTAISLAPRYARPRFNLGLAYQDLGRPDDAERAYRETLTLEPGHSRALTNLGFLLKARGDKAGAKRCFEQAIASDARHPAPYVNLANILQEEGDTRQAEGIFRRALEAAPRLTEIRFNLARLLGQTGRQEEAERLYREILAGQPGHAMARNNLGILLKSRGRPAEAEAQYRLALEADPRCVPARLNYGLLLMDRSDPEAAARQFSAALELEPSYLEAVLGLTYARLALGATELARKSLARAEELAPGDPRVQKLRSALLPSE